MDERDVTAVDPASWFVLWLGETPSAPAASGAIVELAPIDLDASEIAALAPDLILVAGERDVDELGSELRGLRPDLDLAIAAPGKGAGSHRRLACPLALDSAALTDLLARAAAMAPASIDRAEVAAAIAAGNTALVVSPAGAIAIAHGRAVPDASRLEGDLTLFERPRGKLRIASGSGPSTALRTGPIDLDGARVVAIGVDAGAMTGAQVLAVEPGGDLAPARALDPMAIAIDATLLANVDFMTALAADPRLGAAALIVSEGADAAAIAAAVSACCAHELAIARSKERIADRIESLGPARWVKAASKRTEPTALSLRGASGAGELQLAGGRIKEATFVPSAPGAAASAGRGAIQAMLSLSYGTALLGPKDEVARGRPRLPAQPKRRPKPAPKPEPLVAKKIAEAPKAEPVTAKKIAEAPKAEPSSPKIPAALVKAALAPAESSPGLVKARVPGPGKPARVPSPSKAREEPKPKVEEKPAAAPPKIEEPRHTAPPQIPLEALTVRRADEEAKQTAAQKRAAAERAVLEQVAAQQEALYRRAVELAERKSTMPAEPTDPIAAEPTRVEAKAPEPAKPAPPQTAPERAAKPPPPKADDAKVERAKPPAAKPDEPRAEAKAPPAPPKTVDAKPPLAPKPDEAKPPPALKAEEPRVEAKAPPAPPNAKPPPAPKPEEKSEPKRELPAWLLEERATPSEPPIEVSLSSNPPAPIASEPPIELTAIPSEPPAAPPPLPREAAIDVVVESAPPPPKPLPALPPPAPVAADDVPDVTYVDKASVAHVSRAQINDLVKAVAAQAKAGGSSPKDEAHVRAVAERLKDERGRSIRPKPPPKRKQRAASHPLDAVEQADAPVAARAEPAQASPSRAGWWFVLAIPIAIGASVVAWKWDAITGHHRTSSQVIIAPTELDDGGPPPDAGAPALTPEQIEQRVGELMEEAVDAQQLRDYPRLQRNATAILALQPRHSRAAYLLALALLRQRRFTDAVEWARRSERFDPTDPLPILLEGDIQRINGRVRHAREAWERCARAAPRFEPCQRRLEETQEYQ